MRGYELVEVGALPDDASALFGCATDRGRGRRGHNRYWIAKDFEQTTCATIGAVVEGETAWLHSLACAPGWRRQGLATVLLWRALLCLQTSGLHTARVRAGDAAPLFTRFGFAAADEGAGAAAFSLDLRAQIVCVRGARPDDAEEVAQIYNQGIADRVATFEVDPRSADERRRWLVNRPGRFSVLVAEAADGLRGWLSLNQVSPRPVYQSIAEISVYVRREARGCGIGRRLVAAGIAEARRQNFHKLLLTMFPENTAARRLYLAHGFRPIGILHEQALLDGRWRDTEMMERLL